MGDQGRSEATVQPWVAFKRTALKFHRTTKSAVFFVERHVTPPEHPIVECGAFYGTDFRHIFHTSWQIGK